MPKEPPSNPSQTNPRDQIRAFAPKLIALSALSLLLTPWLLRSLTEFTISIIHRMPALAH